MKKILISALMISIITVSCKKEEEAPVVAPQTNEVDSAVFLETLSGSNTNVAPAAAATTSGQNVAAGMNPPHGQPGHRCEIAVGAPLNSAPTTPNNNPAAVPTNNAPQKVIQETPVTNPTATTTAPGMNPAHGQPGHRCEIPVGAPLSQTK